MAHFSQLDENNVVIYTTVIKNNRILDENGVEQEQLGIDFCRSCYGQDTTWKQTSYNGEFRYNFGYVGCVYDESADAFYEPQPYSSWTLNTSNFTWEAPIPYPTLAEGQDGRYSWDEELYQGDNSQGWVYISGRMFDLARTAE